VAAGHFVTNAELALAGNIDLNLLNDTGIDVVTAFNAAEVGIAIIVQVDKLVFELTNDFVDLVANWARIDFDVVVNARQFAKELLRDSALAIKPFTTVAAV
jgi:hypothetical protein